MIENEFFTFDKGVLTFKPGHRYIDEPMIRGSHEGPPLLMIRKIVMSDDVIEIRSHAFRGLRNLEDVVFSNKLENINSFAFINTGIKTLKIPDNVNLIQTGCFMGSKIQHIELPKNLTRIGSKTFYQCNNLESIVIPEKLSVISDSCFARCSNLKNVEFLGRVEIFGNEVFYNCKSLKNFVFSEGTIQLGSCMFSGCDNLENVIINRPVKDFSFGIFLGCYNLKTLTLPDTIENIIHPFEDGYDTSKLRVKCDKNNEVIKSWAKSHGIKVIGESDISSFLKEINETIAK